MPLFNASEVLEVQHLAAAGYFRKHVSSSGQPGKGQLIYETGLKLPREPTRSPRRASASLRELKQPCFKTPRPHCLSSRSLPANTQRFKKYPCSHSLSRRPLQKMKASDWCIIQCLPLRNRPIMYPKCLREPMPPNYPNYLYKNAAVPFLY